MKKILVTSLTLAMVCGQAIAHSGRTDASGGHNCSQKSIEKGLCTGYHYHNDGGLHANLTDEATDRRTLSTKIEHVLHTHGDVQPHTHTDAQK